MNLPKAVEILKLNINQRNPKMPPDVLDALKIGIICTEYWQSRYINSNLTDAEIIDHIKELTKIQLSTASLKGKPE